MILKIKNAEKSPLILTVNILMSLLVLFQLIILFTGRWFDFISMGINIVLVVAGWILYANGLSKTQAVSYAGINCAKAWILCKVILQGIVILEFVFSGIILIMNGIEYENIVFMVFGILTIIVGCAMRTIILIIYIKFFVFIGKLIQNLKKGKDTYISGKYKIGFILICGYEGIKIISTIVAAIFLPATYDEILYRSYRWYDLYKGNIFLEIICDSFSVLSTIMVCITSSITIAIGIVMLIWSKKTFKEI